MNNRTTLDTRINFREWLRAWLRANDFYLVRGDAFLIREFCKYAAARNAPIDEASLGRYINRDDPVLPTPERCRALARVLDMPALRVLCEAGYITAADFPHLDASAVTPAQLADMLERVTMQDMKSDAARIAEHTNNATKKRGRHADK